MVGYYYLEGVCGTTRVVPGMKKDHSIVHLPYKSGGPTGICPAGSRYYGKQMPSIAK